MMVRRLPPLTALRSFEAAARHGSSTRAAQELFVTQGAVSRQIKEIEAWLGVTVFERHGRRLVLSDSGRAFQEAVSTAFDSIAMATETLQRTGTSGRLKVNTPPTFTLRWLLPRLRRFRDNHLAVEVRLITSGSPLDQTEMTFDVAVRRGLSSLRGCICGVFLQEWELPICSPRILAGHPINSPRDLAHHVLLESETRPNSWRNWLAAADAHNIVPIGHHTFDRYNLCLQAAVDGLGVALGPFPLLQDELAVQRLVAPLSAPKVATAPYCWVRPERAEANPLATAFCSWLEEEASRYNAEASIA